MITGTIKVVAGLGAGFLAFRAYNVVKERTLAAPTLAIQKDGDMHRVYATTEYDASVITTGIECLRMKGYKVHEHITPYQSVQTVGGHIATIVEGNEHNFYKVCSECHVSTMFRYENFIGQGRVNLVDWQNVPIDVVENTSKN